MSNQIRVPKTITDRQGFVWIFQDVLDNPLDQSDKKFLYKLKSSLGIIQSVFNIQKIERESNKNLRQPLSIPLKQGYYECAAASLSMLTERPVSDVRNVLITLGWTIETGVDFAMQKKALRKLGFLSIIHTCPPNQKCLVILPSLNVNDKSHVVFWDEKEILDPQFNSEKYLWYGPDWGLSEIGAYYFITIEPLR
jgi:hypothetical protein